MNFFAIVSVIPINKIIFISWKKKIYIYILDSIRNGIVFDFYFSAYV